MPTSEDIQLHQVHTLKLAADASAAVASTVLLWRGHLRAGLAIRYAVPIIASAVVLQMDLSQLPGTARGRYVRAHMPPAAQAVRLAGDAIMAVGAYRRSPRLLITGLGVVIAGWSHGLLASDDGT
jgi:hypothetical protein